MAPHWITIIVENSYFLAFDGICISQFSGAGQVNTVETLAWRCFYGFQISSLFSLSHKLIKFRC